MRNYFIEYKFKMRLKFGFWFLHQIIIRSNWIALYIHIINWTVQNFMIPKYETGWDEASLKLYLINYHRSTLLLICIGIHATLKSRKTGVHIYFYDHAILGPWQRILLSIWRTWKEYLHSVNIEQIEASCIRAYN